MKPFYAVAATCNFYPEGFPNLIEPSFLTRADLDNAFGAGLYRIEFVRVLTEAERSNLAEAVASAGDPQ